MRRTPFVVALVSTALALPTALMSGASSAGAKPVVTDDPESASLRSAELYTTSKLADRRSLVVGDRFYEMGAEDGSYPATGFHTRGEMGGFWTPPVKVLDGLWFKVGDSWLTSTRSTSGWGYQRMSLGTHDGVRVTRTDFAPNGVRAGLVGLRLSASSTRTVTLGVDAHSELMKVYPWGESTPSQTTYNLPDTAGVDGKSLLFREQGTPPDPNAEAHDYAALVGSKLTPSVTDVTGAHRGPQGAVICPASGPDAPEQPARCDDTAYGKGAGGGLTYQVTVPKGGRTVWFSVAGSDNGVAEARAAQATALANPAGLLRTKLAQRRAVEAHTRVSLPGDRLLQRSVTWSKQNLAESVQEARNLKIRVTNAGKVYPAAQGTVAKARWIGAGWPDYPWLFATDGEYTGFAAVASGQFAAIKDHLRALRDVSEVANGTSGKVVHEVTPDGQVYFGANSDAGNTDETAKFPSTVALVWRWTGDNAFRDEMYRFSVRNMRYIFRELDADQDGWPEGLGNVERDGMGEEKLDNTVYTIRGLRDLADMASSKGDTKTARWANSKAAGMESRFDAAWWFGSSAQQYADSLDDPGNTQVFQRHWIGVTPAEAEIKRPGRPAAPLAPLGHARALVKQRETACYSGKYGLFHTGTGATTATDGNKGATCDTATSTVQSERSVFTLNTSIMAVAEAALGRMAKTQLKRYTTGNAKVQLDPTVWEIPGAMPEIAPSPDFGANIEKLFTERSSGLQAWGAYGILWPVVHYQLGVSPDAGRRRFTVVPQIPSGQYKVAGRDVRIGTGMINVTALRGNNRVETIVRQDRKYALTVGALVPVGKHVKKVSVDGHKASYRVVTTARGREVRVGGGRDVGRTDLVVRLR
ncbi:hypothetical protein BH10ACT10_BH10ACT10_15940 [soil metagenome]